MGTAAAAITAAASAAAAAFSAIGTADASYALFLRFINIVPCQGDNSKDHQCYQNIIHTYFFPDTAWDFATP